jgi:DNA-binding GntR family transcriptional regulator
MESVLLNANEKKINASEKAYQKIKDIILSGEASPGQQLKEAALSQALDLTRTPVREALKKLEAEDMVQMIPNRGAFVSSFSERDIFDILDTREALECKAVHLACRRANREELDRIREHLDWLRANVNDETKTLKLDFNFHFEIVKLSKNKFLISAWELLKNRLDLVRIRKVLSMSRDRRIEAIDASIEILNLIADGESELAQEKIVEHLNRIKKN